MKLSYSDKIRPVAVICSSERIFYREMKTQIDESDNPVYYISYWKTFFSLTRFFSVVFMAVAFYIYYLVIPTRQIEDDCLLHFVGCSGMTYAALLYDSLNSQGLLPDLCITHLYVMYYFLLCRFAWYTLFMYYIWKKFKSGLLLDDNALQNRFRMIGYGGPTFVMILANIHAHSNKLFTEFSFEEDCIVHQILVQDMYVYGPILAAIGLNCFFWRDMATYVETTAVKTTEDELNRKKIRSLLTLNRRLFYVFGLPWLIYIIFEGMMQVVFIEILYTTYFYVRNLSSLLALIVPLILVMSRARVWNCVILKYKNIELLQKWQPSDEEEISTLSDSNSSNISKITPSEV